MELKIRGETLRLFRQESIHAEEYIIGLPDIFSVYNFMYQIISMGGNMTKVELIEKMASDASISKAAAQKAMDSFMDGIKKALKKGNKVTLVGFGTFSVGKRAARKGRNPQTGETIKIKASKSPKFKAGKAFKDAIQK